MATNIGPKYVGMALHSERCFWRVTHQYLLTQLAKRGQNFSIADIKLVEEGTLALSTEEVKCFSDALATDSQTVYSYAEQMQSSHN